jgi:hypothetical protein
VAWYSYAITNVKREKMMEFKSSETGSKGLYTATLEGHTGEMTYS